LLKTISPLLNFIGSHSSLFVISFLISSIGIILLPADIPL
jgi:hypothetical protein